MPTVDVVRLHLFEAWRRQESDSVSRPAAERAARLDNARMVGKHVQTRAITLVWPGGRTEVRYSSPDPFQARVLPLNGVSLLWQAGDGESLLEPRWGLYLVIDPHESARSAKVPRDQEPKYYLFPKSYRVLDLQPAPVEVPA